MYQKEWLMHPIFVHISIYLFHSYLGVAMVDFCKMFAFSTESNLKMLEDRI